MSFLQKDATYTYLLLTDIAFDNYLISEDEYYERLRVLMLLIDPQDSEHNKNINVRLQELNYWDNLENLEEYSYNDDDTNKKTSDGGDTEGKQDDKFQGDDFDPLLHFISKVSGKISKWEFHKTDSDFFPSIPHGHAITNHKIKLDSYRGYIYKNNQPHERETKKYIIDLWNDSDFRDTARETILFYMKTYPHYRWRVADPLRLPRRRRRY